MDQEVKTINAARILTSWERSTRENVSIEAKTYGIYFWFIEPVHTIHNEKGNPVFIIVNKKEAIRQAKREYNLKVRGDKPSLPEKVEVGL